MRPREQKIIHTDEKFYISEYLYNFGTISNKYMGTFLCIQFNSLNERTLNQNLKITLKNLSCYTYRISEGDELGEITFVTNKKVNFQLLNNCQILFDPSNKKLLLKNDDNKRTSKCS